MTYSEAITYLYASMPAFHLVGSQAYKPDLENTLRLMDRLGHPYQSFPCVHIAGTNGKGSTSHLIAASLQAAGYKVGLYTSPHLVDFRERIRILRPYSSTPLPPYSPNDTMIPQESVAAFVTEHKAFLDEIHPSFFETTMALAFDYFAKQQVDIAVIEVGLGGRLDATNIITPRLSVITNIGLDHEEFLGDTLAKIAFEKAGIIKPNVPCVIGETHPETAPVFIDKAKECGIWGHGLETTDCRLWFADQCGYLRHCRERDITECELQGIYQEHNKQTAYVALRQLGVPTRAIKEGFAHVCTSTGLRGRWETIYAHNRHFILDTGHNSHGFRYVCEQLQSLNSTLSTEGRNQTATLHSTLSTLHLILGFVNDKDVDVMLRMLPTNATYYFTQAKTHRAIPAEDLAKMFATICPTPLPPYSSTPLLPYPSVSEAIAAAIKNTTPDDIIFIGGSNYVVGEALAIL
ncbi:MAG: bifunctional folylpolyglutamate synthase/dihydrofolate synthase [Paludibacteraceae bacterium]|nr:bifunctional folylpolyglutamate synthase/dihydrofolate synthase [Paludibacteraceae bacterium]